MSILGVYPTTSKDSGPLTCRPKKTRPLRMEHLDVEQHAAVLDHTHDSLPGLFEFLAVHCLGLHSMVAEKRGYYRRMFQVARLLFRTGFGPIQTPIPQAHYYLEKLLGPVLVDLNLARWLPLTPTSHFRSTEGGCV